MIKKKLTYYLAVAVLAVFSSCREEVIVPEGPAAPDDGSVTVSLRIPDMPQLGTRSFGDTPEADLKLTVFEFESGTDATNTFLSRIYHAETVGTTAVDNGETVQFKINDLMMTTQGRVLHFVLAPEYKTHNYASEAVVFSGKELSVGSDGNNVQAYWARVEFPSGYGSVDDAGNPVLTEEAQKNLTNIPMLRNFAKVTVSVDGGVTNFELTGFELVNVPTSGTIAPYNASAKKFAEFVDETGEMKTYASISNGITDETTGALTTPGYSGIMPPGCGFRNREEGFDPQAHGGRPAWSQQPVYLYEHPFESLQRTYVILRGDYGGQTCYYKIDLVYPDPDTKIPQYYDILRNFDYQVTVRSVAAAGARTVSEAITGPTYNNISADVDVRNMLQISNGTNIVEVNKTSIIFTDETPVTFLYRYYSVGGSSTDATNSQLKVVGLEPGDVVKSYTKPESFTENGVTWLKFEITPKPVDGGFAKQQKFTIVDENGLGREINLTSHEPYDFSNKQVFPGAATERPSDTTGLNTVSAQSKQAFTLYFDLPSGMPESMFPLTFTLESNRQNMENNPIGTLVVTSEETGFPVTETYEVPRIKYLKTVSWAEYRYKTDDNNQLIVKDGNYVDNTSHTVRCRLRTINALSELPGNPSTTTTHLLITNPYFNCRGEMNAAAVANWQGVVTFTRTQ